MPHDGISRISCPSNTNRFSFALIAAIMLLICVATTDSTSTSMRLNSSRHAHAPVCARPLNILPVIL